MKVTQLLKISTITFCLALLSTKSYSQDNSAGINVDNPNPNAVLHLVSPNDNQGLLIPTMTTTDRSNMSLGPVDDGLLVYDTSVKAFFLWTDGGNWVQIANTSNLSELLATSNDAGGAAIVNVADPSNAQDVATKNYVDIQSHTDNQDLTNVLGVGNSAGNNTISDLAEPTNPQDAATRNYVDSQGDSDNQDLASVLGFGNTAGNTIEGVLDPLNPQDAATKNYVDNLVTTSDATLVGNGTTGVPLGVNAGTGANQIVQLDGAGALPALDGSALTGIAASSIAANSVTGLELANNAVSNTELAADAVQSANILDGTIVDTDINDVSVGKVTGLGTAATLDAGTGINQIVQLDGAGALPAVDGSALTGVTTTVGPNSITNAELATDAVESVNILDATITDADINDVSAGKVTGLGSAATLDAGIGANQLVQLDGGGALPAVDGSALIGVSTAIGAGAISNTELAGNSVLSSNILDDEIIDADINAAAAITGTKINPNFGGQNITTTGNIIVSGTVDGRVINTDGTNQDDIQALTGVAAGTTDLGTFLGSTITANTDVVTAFQDLETAVEAVGTPAASAVSNVAAGNIAATDVQGAIDELDAEKLALAGGTMGGAINMGANNLTNAGTITGTTVTGTALTDGTLSIAAGNITTTGTVDGRDVGTDGTDQDDIQILTGVGAGTTDLGTFLGSTITANTDIVTAFQDLETAVEGVGAPAASAVSNVAAGNIAATDVQGAIDELDAEKLALAGGTMGGAINMGANNLTNAGTITGTTVTGTALTDGTLSIAAGNITTTGTVDGRDVGTDGTNQDDIQALTGVAAGTTDLGTFLGSTITANTDVVTAFQDLETAVEGVGAPAASAVSNVAAGNIAATDVQGAIDELDAEKLALAGGTMGGAINMGANNLTNAGTITGTTVTGTALTDGTLSITAGNITTTGTVDGRDVGTDGTDQDDIQILTGVGAGSTDLGTFLGSTITANTDIVTAFQDLETAVEGVGSPAASAVSNVAAGNIAATDVQGAIDELDAEKLALAGGTMGGAINMGANNLTNAGTITGTTVTGTALTDGTLSIAAGNITTTGTVDGRDVGTDGTDQDDIQILTGVGAGSTDLGTFLGSTITANTDIVTAFQDLETAVETSSTLTQGSLLVGNGSNQAVEIDASTSGQILIGDGTTITSRPVTGDISLSNTGLSAIATNSIVDADINGTANIATTKLGTGIIDNSEFNNLDGLDQTLATTDNATFNNIAGTLVTAAQPNVNSVGTLSAVTVSGASNLNGNVSLGDAATDVVTVNGQIAGANPLTFQGATNNANTTTLAITDPTGVNTITLPDASGTVLLAGGLANNLALSSDGTGQIVTADDGQPFTVNSNTINLGNGPGDQVNINGDATFSADILGANPLVFQGFTDNAASTTFSITDPTVSRLVTFPDASGTVLLAGGLGNDLAVSTDGTGAVVSADGLQPFNVNSDNINLGDAPGDVVNVVGGLQVSEDITFVESTNNLTMNVFDQTVAAGTVVVPDLQGTTQTMVLSATPLGNNVAVSTDGTGALANADGVQPFNILSDNITIGDSPTDAIDVGGTLNITEDITFNELTNDLTLSVSDQLISAGTIVVPDLQGTTQTMVLSATPLGNNVAVSTDGTGALANADGVQPFNILSDNITIGDDPTDAIDVGGALSITEDITFVESTNNLTMNVFDQTVGASTIVVPDLEGTTQTMVLSATPLGNNVAVSTDGTGALANADGVQPFNILSDNITIGDSPTDAIDVGGSLNIVEDITFNELTNDLTLSVSDQLISAGTIVVPDLQGTTQTMVLSATPLGNNVAVSTDGTGALANADGVQPFNILSDNITIGDSPTDAIDVGGSLNIVEDITFNELTNDLTLSVSDQLISAGTIVVPDLQGSTQTMVLSATPLGNNVAVSTDGTGALANADGVQPFNILSDNITIGDDPTDAIDVGGALSITEDITFVESTNNLTMNVFDQTVGASTIVVPDLEGTTQTMVLSATPLGNNVAVSTDGTGALANADGVQPFNILSDNITIGDDPTDAIDVGGALSITEDITFVESTNNLVFSVADQVSGAGTLIIPDLAGSTETIALQSDAPSFQMGLGEDANTVAFGAASVIADAPGNSLQVIDDSGAGGATLSAATINPDLTSNRSSLAFVSARGITATAGDAVGLGDILGEISFLGHNGTGIVSGLNSGAEIRVDASETWTAGSNGASMSFATTENGSAVNIERLRIRNNGEVHVRGGDFVIEGNGVIARPIVFEDFDASGFLGFKAPDDITNTSVIWELPDGDGTVGQALTTDGSGVLDWADAGLALPYSQAQVENASALFDLDNTGTNGAGVFSNSNAASTAVALTAASAGASGSLALDVTQSGLGNAARFDISNASSTEGVMAALTNGLGPVGYFENTNATNSSVNFESTTNGAAGSAAIFGTNTGDGIAAGFQITNATNTDDAIFVTTNGLGSAANFDLSNGGNNSPVVSILTSGTGPAIELNSQIEFSEGSVASILVADNTSAAGDPLSLQAGNSANAAGGAGGDLNLFGGIGDGAAGGGPGGNVNIVAGDAGGGANPAGNVVLTVGTNGSSDGIVASEGEFHVVGNGSVARPLVLENLDGTGSFGFKAEDGATSNVIFELPDGDGTSGQVLATDASGNLDWVNPGLSLPFADTDASGPGTASFDVNNNGGGIAARFGATSGAAVEFDGSATFLSGNDGNLGVEDNAGGDGNALNLFAASTTAASSFGGWVNINAGTGNGNANGNVNLVAGFNGSDADGRILMQGVTRFSSQNPSQAGTIQLGNNIDNFAIDISADPGMTGNYGIVLPANQGTGALTNDGGGNLTWSTSPFTAPVFDDATNLIFGGSSAPIPIPGPDYQLGVTVDGVAGQATLSASSYDNRSQMILLRAGGTLGSESVLFADEVIGDYGFVGHDGTAYNLTASMRAITTEAWTPAFNGTALSFEATYGGTVTATEMMRLAEGGLSVINENGQAAIEARSFNAGLPSQLNMVTANGTIGAPAALSLGETIGEMLFVGNFGGLNNFTEGTKISSLTTEGWGPGSTGAQLVFETTPTGATGTVNQMLIDHDGNIEMFGTGALQVQTGTTGERPGGAVPGRIRFNTTNSEFEGHDGTAWDPLGGFDPVHFDDGNNLAFGSPSGPAIVGGAPSYQLGAVAPNGQAVLSASSYGVLSEMRLFRANGSQGAESEVLTGNIIGEVSYVGYENGGATPVGAVIRAEAVEDWSASFNVGTALSFQVTPTGTGSPIELLRLQDDLIRAAGDIEFEEGIARSVSVNINGLADGDDLNISAGSTGNAGSNGGVLNLRSGNGSGAGNGGNIRLEPGTGTSNGGIDMRGITRFGQVGAAGSIELEDNGGANAINISAHPASGAYGIVLPQVQGTGALTNDGGGNLTWAAAGLTLPFSDTDAATTSGSASFAIQNTSTGSAARFDAASGPAVELIGNLEFFTGGNRSINVGPNPAADGDNLEITAGSTGNAGSNGGALNLRSGNGSGAGNGGNIRLEPGTGTSNGGIDMRGITRFGQASAALAGSIELEDNSGTNVVGIRAAGALASYTITLPVGQGLDRQTLVNDGGGLLSWADFDFVFDANLNSIGGNGGGALAAGTGNVVIGQNAGAALDNGDDNIIVGRNASVPAGTSFQNIAIGFGSNANQDRSIAIGSLASATGNESIAIGRNSQATAVNATAIGVGTVASTANTIVLGDGDDGYNVGIGVANPSGKLGINQSVSQAAIEILHSAVGGANGIFIDMDNTSTGAAIEITGSTGNSIVMDGGLRMEGNFVTIPALASMGVLTVTSRVMPINGNITDINVGTVGQEVILVAAVGGLQVDNTAQVRLQGGGNFTGMTLNSTLHLIFFNGAWNEVGRSVN